MSQSPDPSPVGTGPQRPNRLFFLFWVTVCLAIHLLPVSRGSIPGLMMMSPATPTPEITTSTVREPFRMQDSDLNPSTRYPAFLPASLTDSYVPSDTSYFDDFFASLALNVKRFREDDNFTIRVVDKRTFQILELYTLTDERTAYESGQSTDWDQIDWLRREETRRLVKKYKALGIPNDAIVVRWGRRNQAMEARVRDEPFLEYELQLARLHGMSAMSTELGTVETFNKDDLVSRVGARGRYQFMPSLLRQMGLHSYELETSTGRTVDVFEERHPLLLMEPAFALMRAYANAVGHELPGLSAYQAGPGNIFKMYRTYLSNENVDLSNSNVTAAYLWGLTKGFSKVRRSSTFGNQSRDYVASAYGAFHATADILVDPQKTKRAEQVTLLPGQRITVSELLEQIAALPVMVDWGYDASLNPYANFRRFNPHLPLADTANSGQAEYDLILESKTDDRHDVRLFLPLDCARLLAEAGRLYFDLASIRRFDENTYTDPKSTGEKLQLDRDYDALIADIYRFGFTRTNRSTLFTLADSFEELARLHPTPYRKNQAFVASIHKTIWQTRAWRQLADAVSDSRRTSGTVLVDAADPTQPPEHPLAR